MKSLTSNTTERSHGKREVLKQLFAISMSAKRRAGSQAVTYHKSSLKDKTFPSVSMQYNLAANTATISASIMELADCYQKKPNIP